MPNIYKQIDTFYENHKEKLNQFKTSGKNLKLDQNYLIYAKTAINLGEKLIEAYKTQLKTRKKLEAIYNEYREPSKKIITIMKNFAAIETKKNADHFVKVANVISNVCETNENKEENLHTFKTPSL